MTTDTKYPLAVQIRRPDDNRAVQGRLAQHPGLRSVNEVWDPWQHGEGRKVTFVFECKEDAGFAATILSDFLPPGVLISQVGD